MQASYPSISIRNSLRAKKPVSTFEFSTLFVFFSKVSSPLENLDNFHQLEDKNLSSIQKLSIKYFFENGGKSLYYMTYGLDEKTYNEVEFTHFINQACDNLMDLEMIAAPCLLTSLQTHEALSVMRFLSQYSSQSNRIYLCDFNEEVIEKHLDFIGESLVYYPNFILEGKHELNASVIASALYSKLADEGKFFHSVANKEIKNLHTLNETLSPSRENRLINEGINPILDKSSFGLRIWGVKTFDSHFNTANEMRVMKHVQRGLKKIGREFLFEPNSISLHDRLFFKINNFLNQLWHSGALNGSDQDEAYILNSQFQEVQEGSDSLKFSLSISISKPLEFIHINLNRREQEGLVESAEV